MSLESQILIPSVIWFQTKNEVFFNIELQNIKDDKIIINEHNFSIVAISDNNKYEMNFYFFDLVDAEKSNISIQEKYIKINLVKKEENKWTHLTKDKYSYKNNIKVNWNSWVDEDAEDEPEENPMGGFDMQKMMASMGGGGGGMPDFSSMMGGGGGMEGMPDFSEDTEDVDEEDENNCGDVCDVEGHNHENENEDN